MALAVKVDTSRLRRRFTTIELKVRRAAADALTSTVKQARLDVRDVMDKAFDRPTRYTKSAFLYRQAKPDKLEAEIYARDPIKGNLPAKFLRPSISGGQRRVKRFERALVHAGVLPKGLVTAPGSGAPIDQYGNIKSSEIVKILSYLHAFSERGYRANSTEKTRARMRKSRKKKGKDGIRRTLAGYSYFVADRRHRVGLRGWKHGRSSKLHPGVWKKTYSGKRPKIEPILMFVAMPTYSKRFPFYESVGATVARQWRPQLRRHIAKQFASVGR